jgi:hypothetical protein
VTSRGQRYRRDPTEPKAAAAAAAIDPQSHARDFLMQSPQKRSLSHTALPSNTATTMSTQQILLKLKIHHGDSIAVTLLPLADMTIETVLEIAALEFPVQFSAAAASSDVLSLFSFGSSGARFAEISSTPLLRSLYQKQTSARVYVLVLPPSTTPPGCMRCVFRRELNSCA